MFYREIVGEFADARRRNTGFPDVVYVYQGTVEQGPMHFDELDPQAIAVADPDAELYRGFGVQRGGMREMFGAQAWRAGFRALRKGHFINRKIGDPWTMPTLFAVADERIVWTFRGMHAGDQPDPDDLVARFAVTS